MNFGRSFEPSIKTLFLGEVSRVLPIGIPPCPSAIHFSLLWIFHQSTLTHALKGIEVVAQVYLKIKQSRLTNSLTTKETLIEGRTLDISKKEK